MIVAEQKPIEEIMAMIPPVDNLLVLGCDTCVAVCLAGGEKEVKVLSAAIRMSGKVAGSVTGASIERQCDREFFGEITRSRPGSRRDPVHGLRRGDPDARGRLSREDRAPGRQHLVHGLQRGCRAIGWNAAWAAGTACST